MKAGSRQSVIVVIDTNKVRQHKVGTGVGVDRWGAKGDAVNLGLGGELFSAGAEGELESEELGHASPEAIAEDDELVIRKLFEFLHQRVHY